MNENKISRRHAIKKGGFLIFCAGAGIYLYTKHIRGFTQPTDQEEIAELLHNTRQADITHTRLTVVYDNFQYQKGLSTHWGFSCLIEGLDRTILFDAGQDERILFSNMEKLNINPKNIQELFISHDHPDHTAGAIKLAEMNPRIQVTLNESFPSVFKNSLLNRSAQVVETSQPKAVTENCISSGELKSWVKNEHSLIILTTMGSIVITGCAHPGIVEIVEQAKRISNQEILLVMGGFHLLNDMPGKVRSKIEHLKELNVQYIAPSHCSGSEAYQVAAEIFGNKFIPSGLGRVISAEDFDIARSS